MLSSPQPPPNSHHSATIAQTQNQKLRKQGRGKSELTTRNASKYSTIRNKLTKLDQNPQNVFELHNIKEEIYESINSSSEKYCKEIENLGREIVKEIQATEN